MFLNNAIIFILIGAAIAFIVYIFMRNDSNSVVKLNKDGRTYTVDQMTKFIKARMDEITRTNLYDIGLSEEELRRRKNKKYELKKALKGCTYGDVNDKKYVKELIFDLLHREYGVNQVNITSAIDFDNIEKLTTIDKFDILLYMYKQEYGYEGLTKLIQKYSLDELNIDELGVILANEFGLNVNSAEIQKMMKAQKQHFTGTNTYVFRVK